MSNLRSILADRLQRGNRDDSYRVALCLDSGGMKGAVIGGMCTALDELGLTECFDDVYGTSSGALAGAYFLAGDRSMGASIFWEHLAGHRFVRPSMTVLGGAMHMNYLFDSVLLHRAPLKVKRIAERGVAFHPLVMNRLFGVRDASHLFDLSSSLGMMTALKAAVRVPIVCGNPWSRVPDLWLDAGLNEPVPYQTPLDQGATHLLLLRSAPRFYEPTSGLDVLHRAAKRLLARPITGSSDAGRHVQEQLIEAMPADRLQQVHPPAGPDYSFFCRDPETLQLYAQVGEQALTEWFADR